MIAQMLDTPRKTPELRKAAGYLPDRHLDSMEFVAEISDRERLIAFLDELDEEFGPTDEAEVAECSAAFMRTAAITRAMKKQGEAE